MGVDVLLIKPDCSDIAVMPPLGLGYLASTLMHSGISVTILDNTLFEYDDHALAAFIRERAPLALGITAVTPTIQRALEIASIAKRVDADILVVMGGPHPSAMAEEILRSGAVDVVVRGEGEVTFKEIVLNLKDNNRDYSGIPGCVFKDSHKNVVSAGLRPFLDDLDVLPFPDMDHAPLELYYKRGGNFGITQRRTRSLPIMASRGCPSRCTFCQRSMGEKFRIRSSENIVDELLYRNKKCNVSEFNFLDDNFTVDKKNVISTCDRIHAKGLKITFRFPNGVREDFLDGDILAALRSVGCYHLDFGIESGSQKVLDLMKKGKRIEKIEQKVRLCKKYGFTLSASFLFGTPGETLGDMEETIRFAQSLPLDSASFGIVIPFPGTELYKEVVRKGYLVAHDYTYYNPTIDHFRALIITPDWSESDLLRIVRTANRRFFFRPKQVAKLLPALLTRANFSKFAKALGKNCLQGS
ncbi:MAG: radical SAM protein [Candidatus Omnitrophica bacterium]|nr:radical SAM protein [Candidatus Omnitrophota bacterium]